MFEKFFTAYNIAPPEGYELTLPDIPELTSKPIIDDIPIIQDNSFEYPGIASPYESSIELRDIQYEQPVQSNTPQTLKGPDHFESVLREAAEINPEVEQYRDFLIKTAKRESGFNSSIRNTAGAPNYGYFQMGVEEIRKTTGLSVDKFLHNPVQQILGAVKLYKMNLKTLKVLGVYNLGREKGYSDDALVSGAWMGGPGGVKKYLLGQGDPSDSHWYHGKGGSSVGRIMNQWRQYE